nr:DNA polymerase III subunit gamma/tau [Thermoactinomyces sp. CICC 10523]
MGKAGVLGVSYRALYRVWRPQRFEDLVGQEHVTKTLMNALREQHLSHAYLFHGPRGTGKTSAAKILAKAVNCEHGPAPEPCNECEACRRITEGAIMDVVEIDAASNRGVDEIRDLRDKVKFAPTEVRYKVYIIDEVHMLTTEAFNALLKTLEEPPPHVIFILATTEPHKLPPTIISRCQRFSFRRFSFEQIVSRMKFICESMGIPYENGALLAIARAADGGMRDALSLLDQVLAFSGERLDEQAVIQVTGAAPKEIMFRILEDLEQENPASALKRLEEAIASGMEPEKLIQDLIHTCRDMLLYLTAPDLDEISYFAADPHASDLAKRLGSDRISEMMDQLIHYQQQIKWVAHPRILLEMAFVRLSARRKKQELAEVPAVEKLEQRMKQLEAMLERLKNAPPEPVPKGNRESGKGADAGEKSRSQAASVPLGGNWAEQLSDASFAQIKKVWPELLHRVKKEKITVHAWLINGDPVAATRDTVILAFKSKIHREAIEKESNRELIETILSQMTGTAYRLKPVMLADWKAMKAHVKNAPEGEQASALEVPQDEDVVRKAIALFGEDVVKIIK